MTDRLFAVADGMGGHSGGEVASEVAVTALSETELLTSVDELVAAIHRTNDRVVERSRDDPALRGMGTTITVLGAVHTPTGPRLGVANVGDSRAYLRSPDGLAQLTDDHSLVETLVRDGRLTRDEADVHPQRNILTRALGIDEKVLVDAWELAAVVGDRYVICSDGLFNELTVEEMTETLDAHDDPAEAAQELVDAANAAGGRDNITVVVVDVHRWRRRHSMCPTQELDLVPVWAARRCTDPTPAGTLELDPEWTGLTTTSHSPIARSRRDPGRSLAGRRRAVHPTVATRMSFSCSGAPGGRVRGVHLDPGLRSGLVTYAFDDNDQVDHLPGSTRSGVLWIDPTVEETRPDRNAIEFDSATLPRRWRSSTAMPTFDSASTKPFEFIDQRHDHHHDDHRPSTTVARRRPPRSTRRTAAPTTTSVDRRPVSAVGARRGTS